jgi:hypothetical protein
MRPLFNFTLALAGGLLLVQLTVHTLRDRATRKPAAVEMASALRSSATVCALRSSATASAPALSLSKGLA